MAESWVIPSIRKAPRFRGSQTLIVKLLRGDLCRRGFKNEAPGVARSVTRSARSLLQAAENGGAGLRYAGIRRLAPRHGRPTAFFDVCRLFPCAGLFQGGQIVGGVSAALELVDADRRYRRNHGTTGRAVRERLRRASEHEPTPAESDAERRECTEGGAL